MAVAKRPVSDVRKVVFGSRKTSCILDARKVALGDRKLNLTDISVSENIALPEKIGIHVHVALDN